MNGRKLLICIFISILLLTITISAKESYWGVGTEIENILHGSVGTVDYVTSDQSKFAIHAINNRYELVHVTKSGENLDFLKLYKGELKYKSNSDGFELLSGDSFGLEFSSTDIIDMHGTMFYWGYFTGVKSYDWEANVYGDHFKGKHWIIPGGVDFGLGFPNPALHASVGVKLSMAFGRMDMDNLTSGESFQKLAFGYEYHLYAVIAVKF